MTAPDLLIAAAFEYAYPLFEMSRVRYGALQAPQNPARGQVNLVGHRRNLSDHRSRAVTTPNNDTLYSACWIDLSQGPVRIDVAAMPAGRYWSVALMDFFSNNFAMLGTRLDGVGPAAATLVGPGWRGATPAGRVLRAPGNDVWLLGRWLVDGPQDLAAAHAMQDGLRVTALAGAVAAGGVAPVDRMAAGQGGGRVPPRSATDPETYLAVVNEALAHNRPPADEAALLAGLATVGLRPGERDAWSTLDEGLRAAWRERMPALHTALRSGLGRGARELQGWRLPPPQLGNFGRDHALRAAVALGGLAALEPIEAVYFSRQDDAAGQSLDGSRRYRIRVPAGGLPTDAFWSLSVYERMDDGRLFFTDNPIQRYAVGDRTPGLQRHSDGSLELWLQHQAPGDPAQRSNWLPAPAGPLQLTLRAYLPRPELREGRSPLPTLERLG